MGHSGPIPTVCAVCSETYSNPRVLGCLHAVCLGCAEKSYDSSSCILCPTCRAKTDAHPSLLLPDYALHRLIETSVDEPSSCTACKSRDIAAIARCLDCSNLLCSNCVMAHTYMHVFEKHRVVTLSELAHRDERPVLCLKHLNEAIRYICISCQVPICNDCVVMDHPAPLHVHAGLLEGTAACMEQFNQSLEASRSKAQDLRVCMKSLENTSSRMVVQFDKARKDINLSYAAHVEALNQRKADLMNELEQYYSGKQAMLSDVARNAQESVDTIWSVCDFVDKQRKYANTTELLMHRKPIEKKLHEQLMKNLDVGMQNVSEIEFLTNQGGVVQTIKNSFGYIRSSPDLQGPRKMAPIARPNSSVSTMNTLNNCLNGLSLSNGLGLSNGHVANAVQHQQLATLASQLGNLQQQQHSGQGHSLQANGLAGNLASTLAALNSSNGLMDRSYGGASSQFSNLLSKRYGSGGVGSYSNTASGLPDLNLNSTGGYEKWSSGDASVYSTDALAGLGGSEHIVTNEKFVNFASFPPRSQIKRQKMIYHCKFGEFGVLEGQFTEPSGVAVNAQNDIIVADTNNHRIQIFDKEGRFKFQFGECGKRDGQLLYPNRVAVVRTSGDIIVTERSPTHQIQIYNQYGQFVRKFGANTLCYPRGVTVDIKGRIIVVECKVMRVIIFDQYGTVLHQFNCPNHLEFPNGVVVNDKQEIFISDNRAHCVKVRILFLIGF